MSPDRLERKVGFLHTTPSTIGMVNSFIKAVMPDVVPVHVYDGNVKLDNFRSPIGITPKSNVLRWAVFAEQLERSGCTVIVSCCSLMSRATAFAKELVSVPFIQLDAVLLDRVAGCYARIGVLTTTAYTTPYVTEGLTSRADRLGRKLELVFGGDPAALALFNEGDFEKHDEIVLNGVRNLESQGVDCVLLGQIPFGMMEEKIKKLEWKVPVLYAGTTVFEHLREMLES